ETGRLKIEAAGLDPDHFRFGAWGSEAELRRGLPPLAIRRAAEELGLAVDPHQTVIVGDTPADIDCAHHNGCRVIAVATGRFTEDQLRPHGADVLLPDLSDLARFQEAVDTALAAGPHPTRS
ncbi:MAG: HAD hydrolase-like protein, partial [Phycisphaerales bacterium]|nr:HAD hydrolase-like protein [Phycisphaerales bacterium]